MFNSKMFKSLEMQNDQRNSLKKSKLITVSIGMQETFKIHGTRNRFHFVNMDSIKN